MIRKANTVALFNGSPALRYSAKENWGLSLRSGLGGQRTAINNGWMQKEATLITDNLPQTGCFIFCSAYFVVKPDHSEHVMKWSKAKSRTGFP